MILGYHGSANGGVGNGGGSFGGSGNPSNNNTPDWWGWSKPTQVFVAFVLKLFILYNFSFKCVKSKCWQKKLVQKKLPEYLLLRGERYFFFSIFRSNFSVVENKKKKLIIPKRKTWLGNYLFVMRRFVLFSLAARGKSMKNKTSFTFYLRWFFEWFKSSFFVFILRILFSFFFLAYCT